MKRISILIFAVMLLFAAGSSGALRRGEVHSAMEIAVIMNGEPGEELTARTIRRIYMKRKTVWKNGGKVIAVNLPSVSLLRRTFSALLLKRSYRELVEYWNVQHFRGKTPPMVVESEEAVKRFVREVEGAIGYIDMDNVEPDMKVVYIIRAEP